MSLFDYIIFLASKRKLLLANFAIALIGSFIFACFMTKYYESDLTFLPPESQGGFNIASLLSAEGLISGDDLLGNYYKFNSEHIKMILESREILVKLIDKFDLVRSYKFTKSKKKREDTLKKLRKNISIEVVEASGLGFSTILGYKLSITDTSAIRSYEMIQFLFNELQATLNRISSTKAEYASSFIEKELISNKSRLLLSEQQMLTFQTKNKIIDLPLQVEQTIKSYSELRSSIFLKQIQLSMNSTDYNADSREIQNIRNQIEVMNKKLKELEVNSQSDYMVGLQNAPEKGLEYLEYRKNVEIFRKIDLLLIQQLEMAKIQAAKTLPSLQIIDNAVVAEYKYKPKRSLIALVFALSESLFLVMLLCVNQFYKTYLVDDPKMKLLFKAFRS